MYKPFIYESLKTQHEIKTTLRSVATFIDGLYSFKKKAMDKEAMTLYYNVLKKQVDVRRTHLSLKLDALR